MSSPAPKYPHVHVQLSGHDGNAFAIIGAVRRALRQAEIPVAEVSAIVDDMMSGDYDHLLRVAMVTVDVS